MNRIVRSGKYQSLVMALFKFVTMMIDMNETVANLVDECGMSKAPALMSCCISFVDDIEWFDMTTNNSSRCKWTRSIFA